MYDFKTSVNRSKQGSIKWHLMEETATTLDADIFPLTVADTDLVLAPEIKEGLKDYLDDMVLGYTMPMDDYYEAIIQWYQRRYDFTLEKDWIIPFPGVVNALYNVIAAFTKPEDKILIMSPVYYPFRTAITNQQRTLVETSLNYDGERYTINFEDFEAKVRGCKMFILCSPHNPIGRVWTKEELLKIQEICLKYEVMIVADEIHSDLILGNHKHIVFNSLNKEALDNTILISAPSKTFNLAGLQASNIMVPSSKLRTILNNYLNTTPIHGVNVLGMKAAQLAYSKGEAWLEAFLELLNTNYQMVSEYVEKHIPQIKVVPLEGTYLLWLDFNDLGVEDETLITFLEQECQIFITPGNKFGEEGEGFVRMNIACPTDKLKEVLNRLRRVQNLT